METINVKKAAAKAKAQAQATTETTAPVVETPKVEATETTNAQTNAIALWAGLAKKDKRAVYKTAKESVAKETPNRMYTAFIDSVQAVGGAVQYPASAFKARINEGLPLARSWLSA